MKSWCRTLFLVALLALPAVALAQEEIIPPPPGGGGGSYTRTVNGQVVEITTTGPVEVILTEISTARVRGEVILVNPGASGSATIRWVNVNHQQSLQLGGGVTHRLFCIESGDIDRRTAPSQTN